MRRGSALERRSPLTAARTADRAAAFVTDLSAAITAAVAAAADDLVYDGVHLAAAVQRALYIELANRPALYEAFREGSGTVPVSNELEAAVVEALCPRARIDSRARPRPIELAAQLRRRGLRRARTRPTNARDDVLAVVVHPKFVRFLAPIVERLRPSSLAILGTFASGLAPAEPLVPDFRAILGPPLSRYPELVAVARALAARFATARPRVAFAVEGNAPADAVLAAVARREGVPSVVLQQGWPPILHAGFRRLPFDRMLVWGDGFARALTRFNPELEFVPVGSHVIRPAGSGAAVSFFFQTTSELIAPDHLDALVELAVSVARAPGIERVLVREHPGHPLPRDARERLAGSAIVEFVDPGSVSLAAVMDVTAVAISIYSTTLFEAAGAGVVPVSFNPTSLTRLSPSIAEYGAGFETADHARAYDEIVRLATNPDARRVYRGGMDRFRRDFFVETGAAAAQRVADAIHAAACRG